jgi:hypothetical protein
MRNKKKKKKKLWKRGEKYRNQKHLTFKNIFDEKEE